MADDADRAPEAAVTTEGDAKRDGTEPTKEASKDKSPGSFGDKPKRKYTKRQPVADATPEGRSKAWLRKRLESLLRSPGFLFEATGDPWAVQHIDAQGPALARALADHAERNPAFKSRLVAFLDGGETAGLVFASIMYAAPLAIYFGILPIPPHFRSRLPIPARGGTMPDLASMASNGAQGPSQSDLEAEAHAKGFDDLGDYMNAVQTAIANVQGPGVTTPPPFETMP